MESLGPGETCRKRRGGEDSPVRIAISFDMIRVYSFRSEVGDCKGGAEVREIRV